MDESFFGKRKFNKYDQKTGKLIKGQQIVVGAIERDTRCIRLEIVRDREQDTLEDFALRTIKGGSQINTDFWQGYNELGWIGYTHEPYNHSKGHFSGTNMIENLWSVTKRHLRSLYYGKLTLVDLPLILNEWQIRQNQPELMYNVNNYLNATVCSGLVQ
jgi:hypothetical protein